MPKTQKFANPKPVMLPSTGLKSSKMDVVADKFTILYNMLCPKLGFRRVQQQYRVAHMNFFRRWFFCSFGSHEPAFAIVQPNRHRLTCRHCGANLRTTKYWTFEDLGEDSSPSDATLIDTDLAKPVSNAENSKV